MRVLIVEDEPDLLAGLAQALREDGYAVDCAGDGEEGLFKAQSWPYDALVLDLMLPKIDGLSLLHELRQTHDTPVLILTARDAVNDRVKGLDSGADDYLVKPFELAELKARLRALIRRTVGDASPVVIVGNIEVDTAAKTILRNGHSLDFTVKEYSLVELLVLHRGKLVTRSMIYDHLFDEEHDTMSNIVDVYVSRIRSQLGKEFITTRRGQGYIVDV